MLLVQVCHASGEQLAFGQSIELTDEVIPEESLAAEGVRVTLLENNNPLDMEFFTDQARVAARLPGRHLDVYLQDDSNQDITVESSTMLSLDDNFFKTISSLILSERAQARHTEQPPTE